jgi:hypothetical protein
VQTLCKHHAIQVLTVYHLKRKRAAVAQEGDTPSSQPEARPRFRQHETHTDDMPPWDSLDGI